MGMPYSILSTQSSFIRGTQVAFMGNPTGNSVLGRPSFQPSPYDCWYFQRLLRQLWLLSLALVHKMKKGGRGRLIKSLDLVFEGETIKYNKFGKTLSRRGKLRLQLGFFF